MPPVVAILMLGAALLSFSSAARSKLSCEEFSKGSTFSSSQAVGTWYLLNLRPSNDPDRCVQFFTIDDKERVDFKSKIEKYAIDVKMDNLALKMQIPCVGDTRYNNKTRDYYLQRLGVDGFYMTLLIPHSNEPLDKTNIIGHNMRLKLIEGKYLALMDCLEHFTFVLDRQPHDKELDPALVKILKPYLPEEY